MRYNSIYPTLKPDDSRRKLLYLTKQDEEMLAMYRQMTPEERRELIRQAESIVANKIASEKSDPCGKKSGR